MPEHPQPSEGWRARFGDAGFVVIDADGTTELVLNDPELGQWLSEMLWGGREWPDTLGGWDIDVTTGFDPEWIYLRLCAAGATEVDGPFPQYEGAIEAPADIIVG